MTPYIYDQTNKQGEVPWWSGALACPNCHEPLQCASHCAACGTTYQEDRGTPILIAKNAVAHVSFKFPQANSANADERRQRYIRCPPCSQTDAHAPYHLDPAHVVVLTGMKKGSRVLELGCGGGQMRKWVQSQGMRYLGTDISKTRVLDWLQSYGGPDILCDAHFLPFRDCEFDVVYSAAVTEHIACPILYVLEARRVLRPGGYFLTSTSFLEAWHDGSHFHLSPDGVIELLLEAGFEIDAVWPGREYTAFRAIPDMVFSKPLSSVIKQAGMALAAVYELQTTLRNWRRRVIGKPQLSALLEDCVVAGAIDWIARRPPG